MMLLKNGTGGQMLNKLIDYIAHRFNQNLIKQVGDIKLTVDCLYDLAKLTLEHEIDSVYSDIVKLQNKDFRRGSCKGCLFYAKDERLLTEGKGYCIFNPRPEIVALKHKCGRIVKR